jgi:hypothetical protein
LEFCAKADSYWNNNVLYLEDFADFLQHLLPQYNYLILLFDQSSSHDKQEKMDLTLKNDKKRFVGT